MKFDLVIPSHGQATRLGDCVRSTLAFNRLSKVLIVHSGPHELPQNLPQDSKIQVIREKTPLKAGEARNLGAQTSQADQLIFLDNDCLWSSDWSKALEMELTKRPEWQAFNGQVLYESPGPNWGFALHLMEFHEFLSKKYFQPRFLHSGNLVIRKKLFIDSGGYREDIPMCTDFTFGAKLHPELRTNFHFIPEMSITHTVQTADQNQVTEKAQKMGYWRGFVESELPSQLQMMNKYPLPKSASLLRLAFMSLIFKRALHRPIVYRSDFLRLARKINVLAKNWATGFIQADRSKTPKP